MDNLHEALHKTREGTKTVTVSKKDLMDLLWDHQAILARYGERLN